MRRNCEATLGVIQGIDMQDLSLESREQLYGRIHTLREIVRTLSFDFEKKLMVETEGLAAAYPPMKFILYCTVCPSFKLLLNSCQLPEVL